MSVTLQDAIGIVQSELPDDQMVIFVRSGRDNWFVSVGQMSDEDGEYIPVPGYFPIVVSKIDGSTRAAKLSSGSIPYYILGIPPTDDEKEMDESSAVFSFYPDTD